MAAHSDTPDESPDDMIVHNMSPYNAEPTRTALGGAAITLASLFYSRNHGPIPEVDVETWRLVVDGLVAHSLSLSLDELKAYPKQEITATLQCAGARRSGLIVVRDIPGEEPWDAGAISTATWGGVRLRDVLRDALGESPADELHVAFEAPDISDIPPEPEAFGGSIPLEKALMPEVLLAWEMNGEPLTPEHGAPVRVVVPGYIGARSIKWLNRIEVRNQPSDNHFQRVAYRLLPADFEPDSAGPGDGISLGEVALNSDILRPEDGTKLPVGPTEISGYAFAGGERQVKRVDVSTDGGATWIQARCESPASKWAWVMWEATIDIHPGENEICVRAWDSSGATQPSDPAQLWNPKGYINNSWGRITVMGEKAC